MNKNSVHMQSFGDELKNYIDNPRIKRPKEVRKILEDTQLAMEVLAKIAKEIEFLANKEIDNKTFIKRFKEIEHEAEPKLARLNR